MSVMFRMISGAAHHKAYSGEQMSIIVEGTPIEIYELHGHQIFVKREDLSCPDPGPSFSKMRGVYSHLQNRPEHFIGVLDTYHSKAGWAVAYACKELGKQAVVFWPEYVADKRNPEFKYRESQQKAKEFGAKLQALDAGRSSVLYHTAKRILSRYSEAPDRDDFYMMPNALKLRESIEENALEFQRSFLTLPESGRIVLSISSGTVAAGVILGMERMNVRKNYEIILHMGYSRSPSAVENYLAKTIGLQLTAGKDFHVVDEGYAYKDQAHGVEAPFPCNPHYDLKAWGWLSDNLRTFGFDRRPVVFWNIGA